MGNSRSWIRVGLGKVTCRKISVQRREKGQILLAEGSAEEQAMEVALEAGAEDVVSGDDGSVIVETEWTELGTIKRALTEAGLTVAEAEVNQVPSTTAPLNAEDSEKVMKLIDMLEDLDDVQEVHTNAEFDDSFLDSF